ncbi:MAG: ROK family protein [Bacteroidota bacterium]
MSKKYVITADLGGTKILSCLVSTDYEIIDRVKKVTDISKGNDHLINIISDSIKQLLSDNSIDEKQVKAISMGVPGTVDPISGILSNAPNLGIKNFNFKKALQKNFNIPVLLENDVNLWALGVLSHEFKNNAKNMLIVCPGTGIGGALIFDGKLYRGSNFFAGEIGHMLVDSNGKLSLSSKSKTFEDQASRTAIVEGITNDMKKGKSSNILDFAKGDKIKSNALAQAVKSGDKLVIKHIKRACKITGTLLGSLTTLLNVDTIVLGGGVIEAMGDFMLPEIKKAFDKSALPEPGSKVKIVNTTLGDDPPIYGGVALAEEFLD